MALKWFKSSDICKNPIVAVEVKADGFCEYQWVLQQHAIGIKLLIKRWW